MDKYTIIKTNSSEAYVINKFHNVPIDWLESLDYDIEPELGRKHGNVRYQRRDVCFLCDAVNKYQYSGYSADARSLRVHSIANELLDKVNGTFKTDFSGILINRYVDGTKYVGVHAEYSRQLNPSHAIAQLFIGASRTFRIRALDRPIKDYEMLDGDLIMMTGSFQSQFGHEIPKRTKVTQPCYVLTLVSVIPKKITC